MLSNKVQGAAKAVEPAYVEDVFSTYLYTGNGATQTITNGIDLAGKGGLVWFKPRSTENNHNLIDNSRGLDKFLISNDTAANGTTGAGYGVASFNSNGFSLNPPWTSSTNTTDTTYASWTFRKQPKFFDVVTWTGNGVDPRNIAHNLGSVPGCMIIKCTSNGATGWFVYHRSTGNSKSFTLNEAGAGESNTQIWGTTTPTSTVFTVGNINANTNGRTYVAYLFAHNAGGFGLSGDENVISCGSYTGVTYPDSLEVNLGFEPQWVMIKNATTTAGWAMWDVMRGMSVVPAANTAQALLLEPNTTATDSNQPGIYPTPTGFVVKNGLTSISGTGDTITYIAIRRGPMKVPTDGTKVFYPLARSGTGSATALTGFGFPPDLQFVQPRNTVNFDQQVNDRLRGAPKVLTTQDTAIENTTSYGTIKSFDQDGISIASGNERQNESSTTYANWFFRRASGFMDVVCDTGTGVARTISHNLRVAPELIIRKNRDGVARNWTVACTYLPNGFSDYLLLSSTTNVGTNTTYWNATTPTTSVFSVGTNITNTVSVNYVTYLFATCPGVSKVGSYTGTGTSQVINCGFTSGARFVLIKSTTEARSWCVFDTARGIVSGNDPVLYLQDTGAETTSIDWLAPNSTGFEIVTSQGNVNGAGQTYIFLAVA